MAERVRVGGHWGDSRSRSVWRWQLILAASAVAIIATIPLLAPELFGDPRFIVGAIMLSAITAIALLAPWHRAESWVIALVPLLDIVAIGLLSAGGDSRLALLWVFPVSWIATYYPPPWLIGAMSIIGVLLLIDATLADLSPEYSLRALVVLLCLGFMGVTIQIGSRRTRAYSNLLRRQFDQLDRTRRRAEQHAQRIEVLSNTLETAIGLIDRDRVLLDANTAFLDLYGAASIDTFTATGAVEYTAYRGDPVAPDQTLIARAARGERFYDHRVWLFDAEGRWRALDVVSRPINDAELQPSNLILGHDVTEAVRAEEQRRNVSAVVTHELRNPLTAIVGHTDLLLERDDLPEDVRQQLSVIDSAGARMERLITSALDPGGQSATPENDRVALRQLVSASVLAFRPAAEAAQVSLSADLDGECPVIGDAFRLRQAVDNLIGNAIKYTARGGAVQVTVRYSDTEASVEISDSGIGMSPHDVERIFEPGWRSATARASGISGSGIGMPLVHGIVTQHDGRIDVTSELGRGTRVTMRLPRAQDASEPEHRAAEAPADGDRASRAGAERTSS